MEFTNINSKNFELKNLDNSLNTTSQVYQIDLSDDLNVKFFTNIYSCKPNISLKFNNLDDLHRLKNADKILFNKENRDHNKDIRRVKNYSNDLGNKNITSKFYYFRARKLEKLLEVIPAYVVLNGQRELVLSSSYPTADFSKNTSSKDFFLRQVDKVCEVSNPSNNFTSSKLGLVFMSHDDAEVYLNNILNQWDSTASTIGLSIHCVSLSSVYKTMRLDKTMLDFRIVPNMKELDLLLNKYAGNSNVIFDNLQYQTRFKVQPLQFFPPIKNFYLNDRITPFYKFVSNSDYFKGVPIYTVQIHDTPRNIVAQTSLNTVKVLNSLFGAIPKTFQTFIGLGERRGFYKKVESLPKNASDYEVQNTFNASSNGLSKPKNVTTYAFFNYKQAVKFTKKYNRSVKYFSGTQFLNYIKLDNLFKKPSILITNLEDFLESQDVASFKNLETSRQLDQTLNSDIKLLKSQEIEYNTYFIPDEESLKASSQAIVQSPFNTYKENLMIKYNIFRSIVSTLFEF